MAAHKRNRRIAAAASFGIFQRLVQVGCTLLITPRLLATLGDANFGIWGAAASLAWLTGLVDIGTGCALVTMVARSVAVEDYREARTRITSGLTIGSCLSCLILFLIFLARSSGILHSGTYLIAVIGLTVNIPLHSANNIWMGLQKGYVSGFWEFVQTVVTTAGLFVALGFTKNILIYVAVVYGGLVLANLGSMVHLFLWHPELRPTALPESLASMKEMGESGMMFFILGLAGNFSYMLDNVLALQFLGPEASARMTIAMRICTTAIGMLVVLSQPLWPAFTDAAHKSDRPWIRSTLLRGTALLVGAAIAGSAVLILFGEKLLRLWLGTDLVGSTLLWAISAWVVTQALVSVSNLLLNGLLLIRFQIGVFSIATAVAFVLKFLLASRLGVPGILWGTTIAIPLIVFPAGVWRIYRWADHAARLERMPGPQPAAG